MTLKDCMSYAISHSTKMRILQAENDDAQLARRDAVLTCPKCAFPGSLCILRQSLKVDFFISPPKYAYICPFVHTSDKD